MPRTEESTPEPTTPDDDDQVVRAVTFAKRTHRAMGIAIDQIEKATRRRKGSADPVKKERPAGEQSG